MFHAHAVSMGADGHMQGKLKARDVWAVLDVMKKDLIRGSKQKLTVPEGGKR